MTLGARIGVGAVVLVLIAIAIGVWYVWKRPLTVYAMMNRRALTGAGLTESTADSSIGPQAYWTGGAGPTLVLLHGAGDSAGTWSSIVEKLAPRYRLVIPDLAGHGHSAPTAGPLSVSQVLTGVEAVMKQSPQEPAIIVGNSLGAWVALLYAKAHPDRVARIVLVNGGAIVGDRPDLSLVPKSREEAAALMTQLRDEKADPLAGFVLDDVVREAGNGPIARLAQTASEMGQFVLDGKLHELAAPVDLLWGESDRLFSLAYARRMMAQLPASRLTTIAGCGHVPQQECPSRFRASLLDVLTMPPPLPAVKDAPSEPPSPTVPPGR
ncbi:MAG: alpha/beta fold hydrolase [Acidobacteria bacterium]|nr:alpha/beta fold hydrolase [Acidobacteriota bacterium]